MARSAISALHPPLDPSLSEPLSLMEVNHLKAPRRANAAEKLQCRDSHKELYVSTNDCLINHLASAWDLVRIKAIWLLGVGGRVMGEETSRRENDPPPPPESIVKI